MDFSDLEVETLEHSTLDAVVPKSVTEFGGWLLPFDQTTIGRAKSAVPLRHHNIDDCTIADVEALYAQEGLEAQFRVADVAGLGNLHSVLKERGYCAEQSTLVQIGSAKSMLNLASSESVVLQMLPTPAWAAVYSATGFDPADGSHRVAALSRGKNAVFAQIYDDGQPAAAGVGNFSHGWASVHGMRTVTGYRNRGFAQCILTALAKEAGARRLERFFLQVEVGNEAALALYRRAGFSTAWGYHYWRKPSQNQTPGW